MTDTLNITSATSVQANWLVGWLAGRLAGGWLVGWMAGHLMKTGRLIHEGPSTTEISAGVPGPSLACWLAGWAGWLLDY